MGYGADAIAHASNGKTLFVQGGVPGDVLKVAILQEKKTYAKARVASIISPSPERVLKLPEDAVCSGGTWANLSYSAQLRAKRDNVADALRKNAKMDAAHIDEVLQDIIGCESEWGYRNKVELAAFRDAGGRFCLGSHEMAGANNIALKKAPLANRLIDTAPKALTGALRYLQGNDDLGIYRVGVRGSIRTKSIEVALWTPPSSFPRSFAAKTIKDAIGATSIVRVLAEPGSARKVKKVEVLEGSGYWRESMGWKMPRIRSSFARVTQDEKDGKASIEHEQHRRFDYRVSAPSFFQVNTAQAEVLVGLVLEGLGDVAGQRIADLYSGVGAFSLPLAEAGADVSAIEIAGSSSRDLERNAQSSGLDVDVICDDAALALGELGALDALVVDPPRAGLEDGVADLIARTRAERVAYVSCDPQTFARDVLRMKDAGFDLVSVVPVDMFPQTYHVECVGIFCRL